MGEIKKMPNQPTFHPLIMWMLYLGMEVAPCYKLLTLLKLLKLLTLLTLLTIHTLLTLL